MQRGELTLVNQTLPLQAETPDWRLGHQTECRLWAITLHYHAWLFELANSIESAQDEALLRGECEARQVKDAEVSVFTNSFGPFCGAVLLTRG